MISISISVLFDSIRVQTIMLAQEDGLGSHGPVTIPNFR